MTLGAAGFLLLAEGHLNKAREQVEQGTWSGATHKAHGEIIYAINSARHALELLKQKKEERAREKDTSATDAPRDDHWYHENPNY